MILKRFNLIQQYFNMTEHDSTQNHTKPHKTIPKHINTTPKHTKPHETTPNPKNQMGLVVQG